MLAHWRALWRALGRPAEGNGVAVGHAPGPDVVDAGIADCPVVRSRHWISGRRLWRSAHGTLYMLGNSWRPTLNELAVITLRVPSIRLSVAKNACHSHAFCLFN
jgi:hypothetical protein